MYVGGKAVGSSSIAEIDTQVSKLRELERAFQVKAMAIPPAKDLNAAKTRAPEEFGAYENAARIAARLVADRTKKPIPANLQPAFP